LWNFDDDHVTGTSLVSYSEYSPLLRTVRFHLAQNRPRKIIKFENDPPAAPTPASPMQQSTRRAIFGDSEDSHAWGYCYLEDLGVDGCYGCPASVGEKDTI
jgi:hypothetical protein